VGMCSDSCGGPFVHNTVCQDGGPGSEYSACDIETDCTDCGPRGVELHITRQREPDYERQRQCKDSSRKLPLAASASQLAASEHHIEYAMLALFASSAANTVPLVTFDGAVRRI
jgi:hypothetical protein